jgi:diadenosine tetraphosphatase ApaH/serine/threonine PP2A family protein phosphatase
VLAAIDADPPDRLWCLGDLVGYGPRPSECCRIVAERAHLCLVGNHDLGVLGELSLEEFAPDAAFAARWTRDQLGADARAYLERLDSQGSAPGTELYHGSPRDPVWEYVLTAGAAAEALESTSAPLLLVGHSHVALAISLRDREVAGGLAPEGTQLELTGARWLLNPGSVGQPRDGDPRAAFLRLDLERRSARFQRVSYPVEQTQAELREAGLPEPLAARLAYGH